MQDSTSIQKELDLGVIYEPDALAMTYDAIGWYMVFGIIGSILLSLAAIIIVRYQKRAFRRSALKTLSEIQSRFENKIEFQRINESMAVIKQLAIHSFGREKVAELSGLEWLRFLDSTCKNSDFVHHQELIESALFQNKVMDIELGKSLFVSIKNWIKHHA